MKKIRKTLIATAFAATVAGTLTGAALSGESAEFDVATHCATAAWPMIPAACLEGGQRQEVRFVTTDISAFERNIAQRFEVAFQ